MKENEEKIKYLTQLDLI